MSRRYYFLSVLCFFFIGFSTRSVAQTCSSGSCGEECGDGSHAVEGTGDCGREEEDIGSANLRLEQAYTLDVYDLPNSYVLSSSTESTVVDHSGALIGVMTSGVRHGGGLVLETPESDYDPTSPQSIANVTIEEVTPVGEVVFSVLVSERGEEQLFSGVNPVGVLCEGSSGCAVSGSACGSSARGVCQAEGSASPSGSYSCFCAVRGIEPTVTQVGLGEFRESGSTGEDVILEKDLGNKAVESVEDDFSSLQTTSESLRGSPNADDFISGGSGGTPLSAPLTSMATSGGSLRRRNPPGDWNYGSFRERGIAWFLSTDRRTLVAQKVGRTFIEYAERTPGSGQYLIQRELGPWGEVRVEHLYDSAGNRTGIRYGRGLERVFSWANANLLKIDTNVYSGDDYDASTKQLFATEYRGYGLVQYAQTGAWVKRLKYIKYPAMRYVGEGSGVPFYDDSNLLNAHFQLEFSHHPTNTFVTGAKVASVTPGGARLREEQYLTVTWQQHSPTGSWRVLTTTDAKGITSSYSFNTTPNSSGRTSNVVTTSALVTTYEYDSRRRLVRRRLQSQLNPRGTEDAERWVNYEYESGTSTSRLLKRITSSSGVTRRWEYHPVLGVVTRAYADDPSSTSGEVYTEYDYDEHPLDGPRLRQVTTKDGTKIQYEYGNQSTSMWWDVGFGIVSKQRTVPAVTLVSGALQTVIDVEVYDEKGRLSSYQSPGGVITRYNYDESKRGLLESVSSGASDPSNRSFMWHKRDSRGFITDFYEGGAETERGNPEKFIHISYVRDQYGNKDELIKHNDAGRHDRHFKYYRDWFGREALIFALNKNADGKPPADASGKHNGMDYTRSEKHFDLRGRLVKTVDYRGPLYLSEQKARADILSNYLVQTWGFHPSTGALASYSNGLVQVTYTSDGYGDIFESRLGSGEVIARRSHNHSTRRKQYKSLASVDAGGAPRYITEDRVFDRGAMQTRTLSMGAEQYQARFKYNRMTQVSSQKVLYNGQETQEYEYEYDELGRHVRTYVTGREGGGTERILFGEVEYNLHSVPRWVKNHRGEQVDFEYDDIGRQRAAHYGDTGVKYTYVAHRNWVESATDVEGPKEYRESYQYDRLGNVVKVRDLGLVSSPPPTLEAELYYNSYGVLERLQYPDRSVFEWSKGLDGFVFWEVPAQGEDYLLENRRMIFSTGTEIQSIDPSGRVTSYKYDNLDLLKSITYPDAKTINYEYDGAFRLSQIVRPGSVQTVNARFPGGQLQQATYTEGGSTITRNYYRRNGRPWKISEAGGNSNSLVEWSYDQFGALQREDVQITLSGYPQQSSSVEVNRRNGSGNFDFRTNGIAIQGTQISDVSLEFEYDSFDRVQSLGYSSGQFTLPTTVATFGYQGNQLLNMSSLDGALGTIHYFDLYNRSRGSTTLSTSLFLDGYFVYRNLLGDVDREISFFSPNGGAGRAFRYDELHRPVEELDGVPQQQLHTEPNFANLTYSRRTSIGFSNGGSSEIPAFHRIQRSNGGAPVDELSRSYSLDNKKGYITGGQQLSGNFEIDYDEVGNVIRDESAANGAGRSYRYDALDRLIEVQDLNGVVISRYGYDPSDRLAVIARGEGELTHNIYHHWTLLADESSSGRTRLYSYVPHRLPDQLLGLYVGDSAGEEFYSITTSQDGSPSAAIRHSDGQVAERYKFNFFGGLPRIYDSNGVGPQLTSAIGNPLGEKGTYWDQEAQVYLNRMRARDPYNSRFLQRDPVVRHMLDGFDEYTVLGNNSLSNFDPVGGQWWGRGRWGRKPHNTPDGGDHDGPSSRRPTHDDSPSGVRPIPRGPDVEPAPGTGRPSLPPADDGITPPGSARKPNPTTPEGSGAGTGGAGKTPDTDGGGGAGSDAGEAGNGNGGGDVGGESGPITGGPKTKPCPSDVKKPPSTEGMEGTPGPGIDQSHLDAVQDLANKTGKTIIVHGSRQTGKKNKPGHPDHGKPWCEGSDVDLGVTKADDLLDLADYTDDWRSIHPDIEHNPMAIMSEADALAAGYLVIRPTGGGSGGG